MNLFNTEIARNLLTQDGEVHYFEKVLNPPDASRYFHRLLETIAWKNDEALIFGKHFVTKRKTAWYGDLNYQYTYSQTTKQALPWTKELLELRHLVEAKIKTKFNSCLLNLYHSGEEGMGWHSDDEKTLAKDSAIASLSLGAERKFSLKHKKTEQSVSVLLEHGSLLVMQGTTQSYWLHCLPKSKQILNPRINLTFRTIVDQGNSTRN